MAALLAVMEATGDGTWYFDFGGQEVHYNAAWYRMLGYEPTEVGNRVEDWLALIHPEDLPAVQAAMEDHLAGRTEQFRSEHRLRTKSGAWLWTLDRGRILARDESGRPLVAAGIHMDISAQKAAEQSLRASEARFRALAELAPVGIFLADATGCTFANAAWSRITGWPLDEALGARWAQAIHPEDREAAQAQWEAAARARQGFEAESRFLTPEGDVRWGVVTVSPFPGIGPHGEGGFIGIVTDTTERHAADALLKVRLKELSDLKFALDQSAIVALTDAEGVILEANEKFTEVSGFSRAELAGRTHRIVNSGFHPQSYFETLWATIRQGKVWHGEIQNRAKDGHTYWVDTTITPFLGEAGRPDHYLAIRFDVSERHRAEDELRRVSAAKDRLVAFVSHELRAPLQAIMGFAELLSLGADESFSDAQRHQVQGILECGARQARLLNDLLDMASLESGRMTFQLRPVHLRPLLEGALAAVGLEAAKQGIVCRLEGGDAWALADAGRLDQVLLNLLSNAVKYNRPGGQVIVRSAVEDGRVRIEVEDTGHGIPEHRQAEAFEAYNRLGWEGSAISGTGLGLSLTRKLVEGMGGRTGFTSAAGVGSRFWVELAARD